MIQRKSAKALLLAVSFAVSATIAGCSKEPAGPAVQPADLVLTNGYVYTVDDSNSVAQAVAISGDRIVFVGSDDDAAAHIGPETDVRDLGGRMVLPGLHDMHIHALGSVEPDACDMQSEPRSLEQTVDFLQGCIDRFGVEEGDWLVALQWPFSAGNQPSERLPTLRAALDAVSTQSPIILWGDDGHHAAVNSAALALAKDRDGNVVGITKETRTTVFADFAEAIAVDENGEPNGGLNEGARLLVRPTFFEDMLGFGAEAPDVMPRIAAKMAANGITSIHDPLNTPESLAMYDWLEKSGQMTFRVRAAIVHAAVDSYREEGLAHIPDYVSQAIQLRDKYSGNRLLMVDGIKLFADAVLEGNPLAKPPTLPVAGILGEFKQPIITGDLEAGTLDISGYVDVDSEACVAAREAGISSFDAAANGNFEQQHGHLPAQCVKSSGVLEHSEEFIKQYIAQLTEAGFHMHVHALSDRGVRVTAQAFADVKEQADSLQTTQSIAHAQLVHPDDQKLLGELGVYSVFTYVWILPGVEYDMSVIPFIDEVKGVADLYNHDHYYMQNVYPVGAMARQGVIPVFGSDTPVGGRDPIPFVSMYAALTREMDGVVLNESQRIGIDEVIASYTINAARMMDHDADLGSIEVGKVADLAVLNQNLVELAGSDNPLAITETQVDLTVFEGNVVFER